MLKIIMTGGTIDSFYDPDSCTVIPYEQSVIPKYISETVTMDKLAVEYEQICMKDSRSINDDDRKLMLEAIENSKSTAFVITHGTFTMFETARYLQANLKRKDITVTVTGSMIPLIGFSPSDAGFELGVAISNSLYGKNGTYVAIKGAIYTADEEVILHT